MILTRTQTYDVWHFGLSFDLSDQHLQQLISIFNSPTATVDATLGGRAAIATTQLEGVGSVVVKHYFRGGLVRFLSKRRYLRWGKPRCQAEYELIQKVRRLGINAPEPIAFAYRGVLFYQGWLVTREIKYHRTLAEISHADEQHAHTVMKTVLQYLLTLVNHKILHPDLHPGNVIVDRQNQVYLLDFDKGMVSTQGKNRLINRYLKRWNRAIRKHGLPKMLIMDLKILQPHLGRAENMLP